jgi:protein-S-isoprenylcysteine O-methyltransferase Ste14
MKNQQFIIMVSLCVFTHIVRTIYEILKHKKIIVPDKLSFIVIFFNMFLLWTSWFLLGLSDPSALYVPATVGYLGLALVVAGVIIFLTALFTIKTLEIYTGDLITTGIYSKIRHPMYLAFLLWLIGLPAFFEAVYSLLIAVPFSANVLYWRHLEEVELINRFADYKSYRLKTYF